MCLPMFLLKPLAHPSHDVVFEGTLNHLMQEVRCDELMYVGTREIGRKRLTCWLSGTCERAVPNEHTLTSPAMP